MSPDSAQGAKKQLQREQSVENEGCVGFFLINPSFHRQLSFILYPAARGEMLQ